MIATVEIITNKTIVRHFDWSEIKQILIKKVEEEAGVKIDQSYRSPQKIDAKSSEQTEGSPPYKIGFQVTIKVEETIREPDKATTPPDEDQLYRPLKGDALEKHQ